MRKTHREKPNVTVEQLVAGKIKSHGFTREQACEYIDDIAAFWETHQTEHLVSYDAFTSASKTVYDESMDIQFIIQSKHGKDTFSWNTNEQEILFRRGTMFEITKISGDTIFLEEV